MKLTLKKYIDDKELNRKIIALTSLIYLIFLIWVIVFKCNDISGLYIETNKSMTIWERLEYKKIPFQKAYEMIVGGGGYIEVVAFVGNILLFTPLGVVLCYRFSGKGAIILSACLSLCVEIFQLFSCWGGFEYMDIVLNVAGASLGVAMYKCIFSKISDKIINIMFVIICSILVPIDAFAVVNSIINFPGF